MNPCFVTSNNSLKLFASWLYCAQSAWHIQAEKVTKVYCSNKTMSTWQQCLPVDFLFINRLALWVKFAADDILKYFSYFSQKTGFDISCTLSPKETICMKCQILFSMKLSSAENAQRVVKVKMLLTTVQLTFSDVVFWEKLRFFSEKII